ncbi:hypothetical protein Trydic_g1025 [Trypoxylus dichotomus]
MRQKWNKKDDVPMDANEGQPIPQKFVTYSDVTLRWKSIAPSRHAIDTYNNVPLSEDSTTIAYDNLGYIPQNGDPLSSNFSTMSSTRPLNGNSATLGHIYTANDDKTSEYFTIGSSSGTTNAGSQIDIAGKDPGSTTSLVRPKFRDRYITVDEAWIYNYTPETKIQCKQWIEADYGAPKKAKVIPSAKIIATVFWNARCLIFMDYLQTGKTVNDVYYA